MVFREGLQRPAEQSRCSLPAIGHHRCIYDAVMTPTSLAPGMHPNQRALLMLNLYRKCLSIIHAEDQRGSWTFRAYPRFYLPHTSPPDDDSQSHVALALKRQKTISEYKSEEERQPHYTDVFTSANVCTHKHTMEAIPNRVKKEKKQITIWSNRHANEKVTVRTSTCCQSTTLHPFEPVLESHTHH